MHFPKNVKTQLWITGSYEAAKAIAHALGPYWRSPRYFNCRDGSIVFWCGGPLLKRRLVAGSELSALSPATGEPVEKPLSILRMLSSQATEIVHAGDSDPGDAQIVDDAIEWLNLRLPVKRFQTDALDEETLKKRVKALHPIRALAGVQVAERGRVRADEIAERAMAKTQTSSASDGARVFPGARLLLPVLAVVAQRDYAIKHIALQASFCIASELRCGERSHRIRAVRLPRTKAGAAPGAEDLGVLKALAARLAAEKTARVISVEAVKKTLPPPHCLSLPELQMLAARIWGFSPEETLRICRALYEKHRILSYPCTDIGSLPDALHASAPQVLSAIAETCPALRSAVRLADPSVKSPAFLPWQESGPLAPLHGIVPLANPTPYIGYRPVLSENEMRIYQLAAKRFIAQFLPENEVEETTVRLVIGGEDFEAKARTETARGWRVLVSAAEERALALKSVDASGASDASESASVAIPAALEANARLPALKSGDALLVNAMRLCKVRMNPPAPFTAGSLIAAMSNVLLAYGDPAVRQRVKESLCAAGDTVSMGLPSERGTVIEELKRRGWLAEEGIFLHCTPEGRRMLLRVPTKLRSALAAAAFEANLRRVEAGRLRLEDNLQAGA